MSPFVSQGNIGIRTSEPENVRELKRDPISQAIECGDCHLSNGWFHAFLQANREMRKQKVRAFFTF